MRSIDNLSPSIYLFCSLNIGWAHTKGSGNISKDEIQSLPPRIQPIEDGKAKHSFNIVWSVL